MEGFDSAPDGSPGRVELSPLPAVTRRAAPGLIWFEATAVLHEARSNPHQLALHAGNVDAYARLVEATRRAAQAAFGHDLVAVIQLTHSGRYSKPAGVPRPMIAHHSAVLDPKHELPPDYPLVSDEYLDRLQDVYVEAARARREGRLRRRGRQGCHRYLGLGAAGLAHARRQVRRVAGKPLPLPPRGDREGPRRGARALRDHADQRLRRDPVPLRLRRVSARNEDRVPDLTEPIEVIRQLRGLGIPLVNVTIGNPYYNPHYGRPYDRPICRRGRPRRASAGRRGPADRRWPGRSSRPFPICRWSPPATVGCGT